LSERWTKLKLEWLRTKSPEDATKFIKSLRKLGVKVYFHSGIKRLVINPRKRVKGLGLAGGFGPSIAVELTKVLGIQSKEEWRKFREKYL